MPGFKFGHSLTPEQQARAAAATDLLVPQFQRAMQEQELSTSAVAKLAGVSTSGVRNGIKPDSALGAGLAERLCIVLGLSDALALVDDLPEDRSGNIGHRKNGRRARVPTHPVLRERVLDERSAQAQATLEAPTMAPLCPAKRGARKAKKTCGRVCGCVEKAQAQKNSQKTPDAAGKEVGAAFKVIADAMKVGSIGSPVTFTLIGEDFPQRCPDHGTALAQIDSDTTACPRKGCDFKAGALRVEIRAVMKTTLTV